MSNTISILEECELDPRKQQIAVADQLIRYKLDLNSSSSTSLPFSIIVATGAGVTSSQVGPFSSTSRLICLF